ncbi:gamma-glutamyltransferase [Sinimarinibacterium thermocellulolyticum]|uniref:Glutathione hydrolase proenzyme n=1 Tax=Sinimarinibacterium thermocellulolyticum TaxID=3170016 RepID=A0ABV2A6C6_9GAMM
MNSNTNFPLRVSAFICGLLLLSSAQSAAPPGHACATAHPLATQTCMQVLDDGGNAFDAAVAASAALAVVEPTGSGIGGGGFWLLHRARDGFEVFVDGRETAPAAAHADMYLGANGQADPLRSRDGALAAAIPGEPAALVHIAREYGSKPLAELLAPAIAYARDGFAIDRKLAEAIERHLPRLSGAAPAVFAPQGRPLGEGERLRQVDLAWTLERLARDGHAGFYDGEVAQRLLRAAQQAGGIWTATDLRRYAVVEREPLIAYFRDCRIVTSPPPSAGGVAMAQVFHQLEVLGWQDDGSLRSQHLFVETLRRAYRDRAFWLGDPDFVSMPLAQLTGRSHAVRLAASIDARRATPSSSLPPALPTSEGSDTTHVSVLDADGNRVAATLSINLPFGSGYMAPGTGVLFNDEMDDFAVQVGAPNAYGLVGTAANAIAPHKRPLSSMTPSFVEGPRGLLLIGTPGGSRIITMVIQGILAWIGGADAQTLVARPRLHHQYLPDIVQLEAGYADAQRQAELRALGHGLTVLEPWGNLQVVSWDVRAGTLEAASDPRGVGAAQVRLHD